MAFMLPQFANKKVDLVRDARPASVRVEDFWGKNDILGMTALGIAVTLLVWPQAARFADFAALGIYLYHVWVHHRVLALPLKMPKYSGLPDPHDPVPGASKAGKAAGIMYLGNLDNPLIKAHPMFGREIWVTNTDARTHFLYLGTTGSGKTEGLKSMVTNTLTWGSGFVYVDGKADTDLWASLYALVRRFGREDDLLLLNYMTANSDAAAKSNTMNPFATGSASYLANMIISLMPDAGGDNAMWKERAVALMFALMPALTWKRENQGLLLDVGVLREYIEMPAIVRLARDPHLPERVLRGLQGYLNTLPGYVDSAFDDEGNERPPSPDQPMYDLQVARQQHGYLSMQFTRSLQSLADEYGYIFKAQLADVDLMDVVLNRRILIALIPALEKSGDEAANLGKIIAASLKGMMGSTLGNTVDGSWENAISSKQTYSSSSFMAVFDEVGYYTAPGMAVMAAQARSLGFSLVFAAQDLPSMEKRVKQEAKSIIGNCNIKIFGKIEDPTQTQAFFKAHIGQEWVVEMDSYKAPTDTISSMFFNRPFYDQRTASLYKEERPRASYDDLRKQREGQAMIFLNEHLIWARLFHAVAEKTGALRAQVFLPVPASTTATAGRDKAIRDLAARLRDPAWTAASAARDATPSPDIDELVRGITSARQASAADIPPQAQCFQSAAG